MKCLNAKKMDSAELSAELSGASMIITGLSNHIDEDCTKLTPTALQQALFGVSCYLDRIAEDLAEMSI